MELTTMLAIVGGLAGLVWCIWGRRKPKGYPPGPWSPPLMGSLPMLGKFPYRGFCQLKPKYGPILGLDSFGGEKTVAISDYKLIKEITNESAFSGRPKFPFMEQRTGGEAEGIIFTEGRKWQEQRRFTLRKLRDFGFGTRSMEAIVNDEIMELLEKLKKEAGQPINISNRLNGAIINALWTIVAGERFDQDDPRVNQILKAFTQDFNNVDLRILISMIFPAFGKYAPDWASQMSKVIGPLDQMEALIRPYIDAHKSTHIAGQPRDFLDAYIDEMKATEDPSSSFHTSKIKSLLFTIYDLFTAGGETTSTALSWICLYLARHVHVQEKLHAEIDRVIGNSRLPTLADRAEMPYMEAVIHEVLRVRPLVPATMQCTMEDTEFNGYRIPKDTIIMLNIWDAHYDPVLWGDPENFRPERFLNKDETKFVHHEGFLVFSAGRRSCLGERLARDEMFLFGAALLQNFEVATDPSGPPPSLESETMHIMLPLPHKLVLKQRN